MDEPCAVVCPYCQAEIDVSPGAMHARCRSCGQPVIVIDCPYCGVPAALPADGSAAQCRSCARSIVTPGDMPPDDAPEPIPAELRQASGRSRTWRAWSLLVLVIILAATAGARTVLDPHVDVVYLIRNLPAGLGQLLAAPDSEPARPFQRAICRPCLSMPPLTTCELPSTASPGPTGYPSTTGCMRVRRRAPRTCLSNGHVEGSESADRPIPHGWIRLETGDEKVHLDEAGWSGELGNTDLTFHLVFQVQESDPLWDASLLVGTAGQAPTVVSLDTRAGP